jgi:hypothetical protein
MWIHWSNSKCVDKKERLRTTYVQGYDALDIEMTRKQATQAVKNLPKKFNGTINVSLDVFVLFLYVFDPHSTGCIHESVPEHDPVSTG